MPVSKSKSVAKKAMAYHQRIRVTFDYPIYFTRHAFHTDNLIVAKLVAGHDAGYQPRVAVFVDQGVSAAWPGLVADVLRYFQAHSGRLSGDPIILPAGEILKQGWRHVRNVVATLAARRLGRHDIVLAIGGGSLLDAVGLAAALVHRGMRLVRLPTTVLSQNDSGVGVKTGINAFDQKNFIGTFTPPYAVVSDYAFLTTLPTNHWIGGVAEAFKVALIRDAAFFDSLCRCASRLRRRSQADMETLVRRCALLHAGHMRTAGDPFEAGAARPLDFGHWAAHKLEMMSGHALGHGQAVAIGMALDSCYAMRLGMIPRRDFSRIIRGLRLAGLPVWSPLLEKRKPDGTLAVMGGLRDFCAHIGGRLTLVMPGPIGFGREIQSLDISLMEACTVELKGSGHAN